MGSGNAWNCKDSPGNTSSGEESPTRHISTNLFWSMCMCIYIYSFIFIF